MRCGRPHQEMLNVCAFNGCKWLVSHCDVMTSYIPLQKRKHMDSIHILQTLCYFCHRVTSVYFTHLLLGSYSGTAR